MQRFAKIGLDALVTPENCVVLLIDHQPFQLASVDSHDPTLVINNVTGLAKTAKAFGIRPQETRHRRTLDGDVSCHARHPCHG
jgi:nicotinamidase-related amidase